MAYSSLLCNSIKCNILTCKARYFLPLTCSSMQLSCQTKEITSPSKTCLNKRTMLHETMLINTYLRSTSIHWIVHARHFQTSNFLLDKSKLEDSLKEKQKQKSQASETSADDEVSDAKSEAVTSEASVEVKKPSLWSRFVAEVKHYYHGFRLLALDVRIASRTLWKLLRGKTLIRRERKQFLNAVSDIFRLAPFSVFIIIPFAEVLLPFALKLFPGMLPSTFETSSKRDSRLKKQLKVKLEMAKFLQDTVEDIAVRTKQSSTKSEAAKSFVEFFKKARNADEDPTNEEILQHAKLFQDELTLDNMGRPHLIALCRLIQVPAVGNDNLLRFLIQIKLNQLHADDKLIMDEGVNSLTTQELVVACQARGMRALGQTRSKLKHQLSEWVDLHLNHDVPNSLLLLSRVLYLPDNVPVEERVKAAILTLPEKVAGEAEVRAAELNLERVDNTTRYKAAKLENAEIVSEKAKAVEVKPAKEEITTEDKRRDIVTAADKVKSEEVMEEVLSEGPVVVDTARVVSDDNKITQDDIDVIDDAISKIAPKDTELKSELKELREDVEEYESDVESLTAEIKHEQFNAELLDTTAGKLLQNRVRKMIGNMEAMLDDIEHAEGKKKDVTYAVAIKDLVQTMKSLTKLSEEKLFKIFGTLDTNKDGHIDVVEAGNVIKILNQEDVEVTPQQLEEIVKLLVKQVDAKDSEKENGKAAAGGNKEN